MNIFWLDPDPKIAAEQQCNRHVVKMILETAQILSTVHRTLDGQLVGKKWVLPDSRESVMMGATHKSHPSVVWTASSTESYGWLYRHLGGLLQEYTYRYEKIHSVESRPDLMDMLEIPPVSCPTVVMPVIPQCMPDAYKVPGDPVAAYRAYYLGDKARFAKWKVRQPPHWWP